LDLFEKAKELGSKIKETQEYQELERVSNSLKEDPEAQQLIQQVQETQNSMEFSQKSGVQPEQEQVDQFNALKEQMMSNLTVRNYMKAQEDFSNFMKQVNEAISSGITGEEQEAQEE